MERKIVAIVGMCGSGKSVVTEQFEALGYARVYFGQVTMDELERRNLARNEQNERLVREELRAKFGKAAFAIKLLDKIEEALKTSDVVIDGLYSWSEYKVLKERFPNLVVIAVLCDRAKRYARLAIRPVRPLTEAEAQSRDYAEIENSEKGGPIAFADYMLLNNSTPEDLRAALTELIRSHI